MSAIISNSGIDRRNAVTLTATIDIKCEVIWPIAEPIAPSARPTVRI
jgi:hypothetical protein